MSETLNAAAPGTVVAVDPSAADRSAAPVIHFAQPEITEGDIESITAALRSRWLTTGSVTARLEAELAEYLGVRHALAVSSCTTALEAAVASLRLPAGSPVAVPAWTFVSTVSVLIRLGLRPVLCDADPDTLGLSVASFEQALRGGVRAAVPVHFAGLPVADVVLERSVAAGIDVVEDCAHALGTVLDPARPVRAACYSFYATKNLTSAEGGAVATNDDEVAEFVRSYRLHGMSRDAWRRYAPGADPGYDVTMIGIKANLPDLLAALALSQLARFDDMQARRRLLVRHYRKLLADVEGVRCIPGELDVRSADHLMVVRLPDGVARGAVIGRLQQAGITTSVHFIPVHRFSGLQGHFDVAGGLETCDRLADRVLSLPLHPTLTLAEVERVVTALAEAVGAERR
ncbi:MAG: DegT/DnrJ/EryC1/StrS family aminotransferase [Acidimicrobiales bacterium]|nr:DegT/DnrJ/EryC1/StrS family aminotransferase [Acidimicrobiales bacterium]